MKVIVTGSLGNISKPLTKELVAKGHAVTVISSTKEKQTDIEALGATAAIGSLEEVDFLVSTFSGADAVYCMVPPNNYFDLNLDLLAYYRRLGNNYARAIEQSGVKRVVNLSSIGAHLEKGSGILLGAHDVEQILNKLSSDVAITHLRPTSFYYNLFGYVDTIKAVGFSRGEASPTIAANYGADDQIPWVSPIDIAAVIAEEIATPHVGRKVRYVASEELTANETARILGAAIGKPELKWIIVSNAQMLGSLKSAGMNPQIAAGLVEMYASLHSGLLAEDYYRNKPTVMGKVKLADFAKEFAAAF
ncbi:NAD(P)H-binding protein [Chamaesiphon sp. OTE_20_metabat_361]|uniref:NAD(P)H-binding protein n=1 Tax=Chamaesiphon sp. OTE_20_metabat_361 TaxID=2964689 RepID=UPI00286BB227|nr:NAD(P)H-binding protein [Chamaesiphon sp. OTE_20_metabat_361]